MPILLDDAHEGHTHVKATATHQPECSRVWVALCYGDNEGGWTDGAPAQARILRDRRGGITDYTDLLADPVDVDDEAALSAYTEQWLVDGGLYPGTVVA